MGDKAKIGMDVGHRDNNPLNNDPKNLKNEDPSKNRREPRLREDTFSESWWADLRAKMSQLTHPKGWDKVVKQYVDGMKDKENRDHPGAWAGDVARRYNGINGRQLAKYIDMLVDKGKLPKELKTEYQPQMSFKQFVEVLSKNADQGEYIKDFETSDAPQFKGKSKEKRKKMAIAAFKSKDS